MTHECFIHCCRLKYCMVYFGAVLSFHILTLALWWLCCFGWLTIQERYVDLTWIDPSFYIVFNAFHSINLLIHIKTSVQNTEHYRVECLFEYQLISLYLYSLHYEFYVRSPCLLLTCKVTTLNRSQNYLYILAHSLRICTCFWQVTNNKWDLNHLGQHNKGIPIETMKKMPKILSTCWMILEQCLSLSLVPTLWSKHLC